MFYYLATPYRRFPGGLDAAHRAACEQAAILTAAGVPVFSPIAHTHHIAGYGRLDGRSPDWLDVCRPFMAAATLGIIECRLPSWPESEGMTLEVTAFVVMNRPHVVMFPGRIPAGLHRESFRFAVQADADIPTGDIARLRGRQAYLAGRPFAACPFVSGDSRRIDWQQGWHAAKIETAGARSTGAAAVRGAEDFRDGRLLTESPYPDEGPTRDAW